VLLKHLQNSVTLCVCVVCVCVCVYIYIKLVQRVQLSTFWSFYNNVITFSVCPKEWFSSKEWSATSEALKLFWKLSDAL
jgi:hypothetical protein